MRDYVVSIKGPLSTPVGGGVRSLNVALRQELALYVCLRPIHAEAAGSAQKSRQCSDTLLLLAQLADTEGDDTTAIDLLSKLGMCRSPSTNHCARMLARVLGVAEQRARDEHACSTLQSFAEHDPLGVRRAMAALHAEIKRRDWA